MILVATDDRASGDFANYRPNCRRSERMPHSCDAWLSSPTATNPADRIEVTVLDLSRHGVAFELQARIPTGAFYVLRFDLGTQKIDREIRILSCRPGDESFRIGAEFC